MFILRTGKGCNLARNGNLLVCNVIKAADKVHPSTIVEQQRFIVTPSCIGDTVVQATCADNLVGGNVEKDYTVFTHNQQLAAVIHILQVEGSINIFYNKGSRPATIDDHQMPRMADGIALAALGCTDITETILLSSIFSSLTGESFDMELTENAKIRKHTKI